MPLGLDMASLTADNPVFVCPQSGLPLRAMSLAQAKEAAAAGADVIIAQGRDAGGHSAMTRATMAGPRGGRCRRTDSCCGLNDVAELAWPAPAARPWHE